MALTLPYPTYSAFVPATVHSQTIHNTPHAGLLSNDVAIKSFVDSLETSISSISSAMGSVVSAIVYTQAAAFGTSLTLTSSGLWVVLCMASLHSSTVSAYTLTMDGTIVQTSFALGDPAGTDYIPFFGIASKYVSGSSYSFISSLSSGGAYANSGRIGMIAFKTSS